MQILVFYNNYSVLIMVGKKYGSYNFARKLNIK